MRSRGERAVAAAAIVLAMGSWCPSLAHVLDQAVVEIVVRGREAEVTLTLPRPLLADADRDGNGVLDRAEVRDERLVRRVVEGLRLWDQALGRPRMELAPPLPGALAPLLGAGSASATLLATDAAQPTHGTLRVLARFERDVTALTLDFGLFAPGAPAPHCVLAALAGDDVHTQVLVPGDHVVQIGRPSRLTQAVSFVRMGMEHILTGYDHVLFLMALLMVGAGLWELVKVVTSFTVAHSVTLTLAVLGLVDLPSRLVESVIALSIVYVGVENLVRREFSGRWRITFLFGLVHGLGFATALRELGLPRPGLAMALVGFNGGVELGQLVVVLVAAPSWALLRRWPREPTLRGLVSLGVALAGLAWLAERALGLPMPWA